SLDSKRRRRMLLVVPFTDAYRGSILTEGNYTLCILLFSSLPSGPCSPHLVCVEYMEIRLILRQRINRQNAKGNLGVDFQVFERNYTANRDHRLIVLVIYDEHNAPP